MDQAVAASFLADEYHATGINNFPDGFKFQLGTEKFTSFSISKYGYVKFGARPFAVNPNLQDSVIVPLYCFPESYVDVRYKLSGAAPYRKMVIEWRGTMFNGQLAVFQLWLYETNGKVSFVYNRIQPYASQAHHIFLKQELLGIKSYASVKLQQDGSNATVNYTGVEQENYGIIPAKTRFTFQPDTLKPASPEIAFGQIFPGCFNINFTDHSNNESAFTLQKQAGSNGYYHRGTSLSKSHVSTGEEYVFSETGMQPDSVYSYRGFSSNGFINSDTIYRTIRTPMPLLNGIIKIPGDYPSINALLADAACKHIGPDLIVELQKDYNYKVEPIPVRFRPFLQNHVLRSLVIRPAEDAGLKLTSTANAPLFTVDSVKNVRFDGRPGGKGNSIGMIIEQLNDIYPAISYVQRADSGTIEYCDIRGTSANNTFGVIYLGGQDAQWFNSRPSCNGSTIRFCKVGPANGGRSERLLVLEGVENLVVENNSFYRFKEAAVIYKGGGKGSRISGNRFYQPEHITGTAKAVACSDQYETIVIENNEIGGSEEQWGKGMWQSNSPFFQPCLIEFAGGYGSKVIIRGNAFANIAVAGGNLKLVAVVEGVAEIKNNLFGSTDSSNAVVGVDGYMVGVEVGGNGRKKISGNIFSGLTSGGDLLMLAAGTIDSLLVRENDFGGSDRRQANRAGGQAIGISLFSVPHAIIVKNEIRGITAGKHMYGIHSEWTGGNGLEKNITVDSNLIHHLQGHLTVFGLAAVLNSQNSNSISHNRIYALRAIGPFAAIGASQPSTMNAIAVTNYRTNTLGSIIVSANKIHSLEYMFEMPEMPYIYQMTGINVSGSNLQVANNMIQLGIAANGKSTDSIELQTTGMALQASGRAEVEHNSIYIGGTGDTNTGVALTDGDDFLGPKRIFLTNNIIQLDRSIGGKSSEYSSYISTSVYSRKLNNIASNYNLWYSATDTAIATKLATWSAQCGCDSSSFIANPGFIQPAGDSILHDLHLQAGSPANGAGTPAAGNVPTDIDGDERQSNSPVDIGADATAPCAGTPLKVELTANGSLSGLCAGVERTLNANITGGAYTRLQWQKDLQDIQGAQAATLRVTKSGSYRLVASSACGAYASQPVSVSYTVVEPPTIWINTSAQPYICENAKVEIRSGYVHPTLSTPTVRWYRNGVFQSSRTALFEVFDNAKPGEKFRVDMLFTTTCQTLTVSDSITIHTIPNMSQKIQVLSGFNMYRTTDSDTIHFRYPNKPFDVEVVFQHLSDASPAILRLEGDSMFVLTGLPPSTHRVRLYAQSNRWCFVPDTTAVIELKYGTEPVGPPTAIDVVNGVSDSAHVVLFPNPSTGTVWLQSNSISGYVNVDISHSTGHIVDRTRLYMEAGKPILLTLPPGPKGMHIVRVQAGVKSFILKTLVQ